MTSFRSGLTQPYVVVLLGMVGAGTAYGLFLGARNLTRDPHIVITDRRTNPFPWLSVTQGQNLKLMSVNRKWEEDKTVKPTFS